MTVAHVGTSRQVDSSSAGAEAAAGALGKLDGQRPSMALVFASADHDHEALLEAVRSRLPGVPVVGCSGEGIIADDDSNEVFAAAAVMAIASDLVRFETFLVEDYATDPAGAGRRLAALVNGRDDEARCLCVMPDGLAGNCTEMLQALHADLRPGVAVVGGAAADAMSFERTFQYGDGRVISGGMAAFLISGPVDVAVAVSHGCTPIGGEREVTRSADGWIHEIDGRPAWQLFKEYLDDDAGDDLNAEGIVHLCVGERLATTADDYDPFVIRTPLQLDKPSGALFFPGGGLTEGRAIQLTRRDPDRIRESARDCADRVRRSHPERAPDLVLQFDCAGRGRILWGGCAAAEIVAPLRRALGPDTPWIGFHTYGEIAPIGGRPYYHNYTVALCALYERQAA
ncbi:MAG: FIST N-terminal domain-containing protein [Vicinamibacterales bacterium]